MSVEGRLRRLGFVLNPIAGMGGRVGLKGTDGVVERAVELGAHPSAPALALECLEKTRTLLDEVGSGEGIEWLTCQGAMGGDVLREVGFARVEIVYRPETRHDEAPSSATSSAGDTRRAVASFLDRAVPPELILFCGGDGTARDVCSEARRVVPILGIPAGVKMYSGVFGVSATGTARVLVGYLLGELDLAEVDVLDLDEERYRSNELVVRLYDVALTPREPSYTQVAKAVIEETPDSVAKQEIAEQIVQLLAAEEDSLILLGPGSTVAAIAERLGIEGTLLGVDAVRGGQLVGRDLNESDLLTLLESAERARLIASPLGAAGFVLGRGNKQLSPEVVRRIGRGGLIVVATPAKLSRTPALRFDTGDAELDRCLVGDGYLPVVTGFNVRRLVLVETTR